MRNLSRDARIWLPPIAMMALIFALSAMPAGDEDHGILYLIVRKLAHVSEYALLLALWWRALATKLSDRRALAFAFGVTILYAITDEFHQTFVDGRSGRPLDIGIDAVGALAAAGLIARKRVRREAAA
ncbi:MAG: VanZ family protein [Pseudonocardiaceae bacterium]